MKTIRLFGIITTLIFGCLVFPSCGRSSLKKNIIQMIENHERQVYTCNSPEELRDTFYDLLEMITKYLDVNDNYRYTKGEEDYEEIMERMRRFNAGYTNILSLFDPEISWKEGEREKAIQLMAIMEVMENNVLTTKKTEIN